MINKNIKSVGWFLEDGEVIDDINGIYKGWVKMFNEGVKVNSFEEGCEEVKKYVLDYGDENDWKKVKKKLNELKKLNKGEDWILWNIERDYNLGFKVSG